VAVGLGILGAAELILEPLGPDAARPFIVIFTLLGFPVAVVLAWAYETTPDGIRRDTRGGDTEASHADSPVSESDPEALSVGPDESSFDPKAIAVLPFANLSEVSGNEFFADGVAEDILTRLSQIPALHVVSRTSVIRYKGTEIPIGATRYLCLNGNNVFHPTVIGLSPQMAIILCSKQLSNNPNLISGPPDATLKDASDT